MKPVDVRQEIAQLEKRIKSSEEDLKKHNSYHNRVLLQSFTNRRTTLIEGLRSSFKVIEGGIQNEESNKETS